MRGDDIVGIHQAAGVTRVLKGEAKSRANLQETVVKEACDVLLKDNHRPRPSTLAFVARVLRREGRDTEAELVERLQTSDIDHNQVTHLVFTLSGNDPEPLLRTHAGPRAPIDDRRLIGLRIEDHQAFIESVFEYLDAGDD